MRGALRWIAREVGAWRADRRATGARLAAARRVRHYAGTDVLTDELRAHVDEINDRQARVEVAVQQLEELEQRVESIDAGVGARLEVAAAGIAEVKATLNGLAQRLDGLDRSLTASRSELGEEDERVSRLEGLASIQAVTAWVEQTPLRTAPLVSVVLPTRNRSDYLPRAMASVIDQAYPHWELLVVDDGGDDETADVVRSVGDERIRYLRVDHIGVCAARNHALADARGELVAYLDDDNTMHPLWLKALVWAFEQRPEVDVLYGAFVVDDELRVNGRDAGKLPEVFLFPYERERVLRGNVADISAIAHRAGLPEARFDPDLREMGDWDLLLRLTKDKDPLVLPMIACFYSTDAPDRLSGGPTARRDHERVRAKNPR